MSGKFSLLTALVAWSNKFLGTTIGESADEVEVFDTFKGAVEDKVAGLQNSNGDLEKRVSDLESAQTLSKTLQTQLDELTKQLNDAKESLAAAKAESEKQIKNMKDQFAQQLAGTKEPEGSEEAESEGHAIKKETKKEAHKRITMEHWNSASGITKVQVGR